MAKRVYISKEELQAISDAVDMISTAMQSANQEFINAYTPTIKNLNNLVDKYHGKTKKVKHWSEVLKNINKNRL